MVTCRIFFETLNSNLVKIYMWSSLNLYLYLFDCGRNSHQVLHFFGHDVACFAMILHNFAYPRTLFLINLPTRCHYHYYIVPFCEGPNKKPEGFAKPKKSAKFAMRHASQLVVHHSSQTYNEPLIIATLLRHTRQPKLCDPLSLRPLSRYSALRNV